jgi:hypothetical protein
MTIETPGKLNLTIARGIDFSETLVFSEDGTAMDLTGWSVFAEARKLPSNTVSFELGAAITTAASGIVTLTLTDVQTEALTAGVYGWDLVFEDDSGIRRGPYLAGTVTVKTLHTHP